MNKKILWIIAVIIIFIGAGVYFMLNQQRPSPPRTITNFEECERAGYPVGESYPRQCWTSDGGYFVEESEVTETSGDGCVVSGCNREICAEEERFSICIYLPEHACYQNARCERQEDRACGWTMTEELRSCLNQLKPNLP
ncbi:MAG: hypothetical protein DDT19_00753 [Syntrophomonadaceae bacterium]|nr:hypothetical protein [Bacillota bacterium]